MLSPIFKLLTERLRKSQVSLNQLARIVDQEYCQVNESFLVFFSKLTQY